MTATSSSPSPEQIKTLLRLEYGLAGEITRLPGENDNFQVVTQEGERFVLKLSDNKFPVKSLMRKVESLSTSSRLTLK